MNISRKMPQHKKKWKGQPMYVWLFRIMLVLLSLIFIYPMFFALLTSLKSRGDFYNNLWGLPEEWMVSNYLEAWITGRIGEYFGNSIIITGLSILGIMIFAILAAYALSRLNMPKVNWMIMFLFGIQMLPTETIIIPVYLMMSRLQLLRIPYLPLVLGYIGWSLPGTIIIMKNFFDTVPNELLEAARIDGASELRAMLKVIIPLMKGAMATCFVMNFTSVWGELMWAQIATLTTDRGIPLTVGLLNFQGEYGTDWPLLCGAIIVIAVPLYLLFLFTQKYFVKSLTSGGVKG